MQILKEGSPIGIGSRVGRLTVMEKTDQRKNGYMVWRCACDCGGEILLDTRSLQRGAVQDCGCSGFRGVRRDLTGERFGKLVCLEPTRARGSGGGVVWRCRCDCGNEVEVVNTQLLQGFKKSCGCLGNDPRTNLTGERFGALTVIGHAGKREGKHMWRCRCNCGKEVEVSQWNLQDGHTKSCGCLQRKIYRKNLKLAGGTSVTIIEHRMRAPVKKNTSGVSGVIYNDKTGKWMATITFKRKIHYLGSYSTVQEAIDARKKGEQMYRDFLKWYYGENDRDGKP